MDLDALHEEVLVALDERRHREYVCTLRQSQRELQIANDTIATLRQRIADLEAANADHRHNPEDERHGRQQVPAGQGGATGIRDEVAVKDEARDYGQHHGERDRMDEDVKPLTAVNTRAIQREAAERVVKNDPDRKPNIGVDDMGVVDLSLGDDEDTPMHTPPSAPSDQGRQLGVFGAGRAELRNATPGPGPATQAGSARGGAKRPADSDNDEDAPTIKRSRSVVNEHDLLHGAAEDAHGKLSVRKFVARHAESIWDKACDLTAPNITQEGVIYEMGDIVLIKNHCHICSHGSTRRGGATRLLLPDMCMGILCNSSTINPYPNNPVKFDKIIHPSKPEGGPEFIAIAWLLPVADLAENAVRFLHPKQDVHTTRERHFFDDELLSFLNMGIVSATIGTHLLSKKVDWIPLDRLCGHLNPHDIRLSNSVLRRKFTIDWRSPVITCEEECREEPEGRRLLHTWSKLESSGLKQGDLPDGSVDE